MTIRDWWFSRPLLYHFGAVVAIVHAFTLKRAFHSVGRRIGPL